MHCFKDEGVNYAEEIVDEHLVEHLK